MDKPEEIRELLNEKASSEARLRLLPYNGSPEIKEIEGKRYLYVRKRELDRNTSTYVGPYTDELYQMLVRNNVERRSINKQLRLIAKKLAQFGYSEAELSPRVKLNIDFARANVKSLIYDQAILEGVATTFTLTEDIIEGGMVSGMTVRDIQKVINLKHAWEFILDEGVLSAPSDYNLLSYIAKLVNEDFIYDGGRIRSVPVSIGGSTYVPPMPMEFDVKEKIRSILDSKKDGVSIAIDLCLYCMKTQIFDDGNKRASVILANHYLIAHGLGIMAVKDSDVPEFKKDLVAYYEGKDEEPVRTLLRDKALRTF
ncbi:MAG: Fic family protein [Bacilli bacterium]|jgi:Fic family protein|nr:Fic family protein [Bacilli bacterium]